MREAQTPKLGPVIRNTRLKASIDLETMAKRISITKEQMATIESGTVVIPYMILLRCAAVLEILPGQWFQELDSSEYDQVSRAADGDVAALMAIMSRTKRKLA